ncbi:MAG: MBL fold metallo-hydrolase [Nevskiaceae bacterium]
MTESPCSLNVGSVRVDAVVELATVPLPFTHFLPDATPEAIAAEAEWLLPRFADASLTHGLLSFHTYVLRSETCTILVDTCIGNDKERGGHAGFHRLTTGWLHNLHQLGVAPESVDYVMCTHMHGDHVGWNTRLMNGRWVPTFPNARYVFARQEFEHRAQLRALNPGTDYGVYTDSVLPVIESGQADLVESDHEVEGLLRLEAAPGHTPGNVVIHLQPGREHAVLSGDVIHHPLQVKYPEWSAAFCEDRVASAACRRRFVETHADTDTLILPAHFPAPTAGFIRSHGNRWRYSFAD